MTSGTDLKMYAYKAVYKASPDKDVLKNSKCIIAISVGQPIHEGHKFIAILKLVSSTFKECSVIVCDTLQRHSLGLTHLDMNDEESYNLSLERGDSWISRNKHNINLYLTIPHDIVRWDNWLQTSEYNEYHKQVEQLYKEDADYKVVLDTTASNYLNKLKRKQELKVSEKIAIEKSLQYLKEESALVCVLPKYQYKFIVYPANSYGVVATLNRLAPNVAFLFYTISRIKNQPLIAFQDILDVTPAHTFWKNKEGVYLGANKAFIKYLGFTDISHLLGKTDFELFDNATATRVRELDLEIMKSDKPYVVKELDLKKERVFLSHKTPLKDSNNEVFGIIGNAIDVTQQSRAEEAHAQKTKELVKALEVKDTFLSNMSHEIRTPLQGIFGLLELLEDEEIWNKTPDSEKRRMFKNVLDSRDRFMNLLSNLLDLSDLRKGRGTLQIGYHDMKSLISNTAQEFQNFTQSITMDVPANVNTYISCDDWRISQVLHNVIANCIKHGGQDKPIHITLDTLKEKDKKTYLKISIQDEGIGIPEDQLEEIFDPFTESNRTRRISGGTGIGLALCKDIIAAHRGKIWAENNASGIGSTFFIALPYADHPKKIYSYRLTQKS